MGALERMMMRKGDRNPIQKAVLLAGTAAASLMGAVAFGGYAKGRSVRAQAVVALLWATRRRRRFESAENLKMAITKNRMAGAAPPPKSVKRRWDVTEEQHHGARVFLVRPKAVAPKGTILYIHGGGYVFDLIGPHWTIIAALAEATGAQVVVPLYPLAPEAAYRQGFALLEHLWTGLTAGGAPVAIAGDSAGGGFALALAQRIRDAGWAKPAALLLFSPWVDVRTNDPLQAEIQPHDPMLFMTGVRQAGEMWAGGDDLQSPMVSPIFGQVDNLPPIAIFIGSSDILMPDACRLRDALASVGTPADFHEYPRMFHVWVGAPVPEARIALGDAGAFLKRWLHGGA
ncbi:alpha/beta hydrolase [Acetobacteraceae bacterium KSS8]|uniref:Alpha/beta hydrolase n=1 Tax=Endosaccharibacter trunci TaxID=2812733 RepID=A0ABT1W890_9PROT|nr:alpha/beta hydrolase [Acetobacteraceae bacterium KSS8]